MPQHSLIPIFSNLNVGIRLKYLHIIIKRYISPNLRQVHGTTQIPVPRQAMGKITRKLNREEIESIRKNSVSSNQLSGSLRERYQLISLKNGEGYKYRRSKEFHAQTKHLLTNYMSPSLLRDAYNVAQSAVSENVSQVFPYEYKPRLIS